MSVLQCMWPASTELLYLPDVISFATTHKGITPAAVTMDTVYSMMAKDVEVFKAGICFPHKHKATVF